MTAAQTPGASSNGERVFIRLGPPPEEPNQFVVDGAPQTYPPDVRARLEVDAKEIIGKYPNPRSALLPLLHGYRGGAQTHKTFKDAMGSLTIDPKAYAGTLDALGPAQRAWLADALARVHPGHSWLQLL